LLSLHKIVTIFFGSLLIAVGIDFFVMPIKALDGGFIGLALIGNYLFGARPGMILISLSLPVFIYTWMRARGMFFHSLFGLVFLSYLIDLFAPYEPLGSIVHDHPFAAAMAGGLLIGIGFGILLRNDTSAGGIDLLAKLLAPWLRLNVGVLILIMDALVVGIGGLIFSLDTFFLSIATITTGGLATSLYTSKFFDY